MIQNTHPTCNGSFWLFARVSQNLQQLEALESSLGGEVQSAVSDSIDSLQTVQRSWQEAVTGLKMSDHLLLVHKQLKAAYNLANSGKFLSSAKCLQKVRLVYQNF